MNINSKEIGLRIQYLRKKNHLSQAELATKLSYSVPYISNLENGKKNITLPVLLDIASEFGVTPDYILFDEKAHNDSNEMQLHLLLSECNEKEYQLCIEILQLIIPLIKKYL